jgi:hypothetical protein
VQVGQAGGAAGGRACVVVVLVEEEAQVDTHPAARKPLHTHTCCVLTHHLSHLPRTQPTLPAAAAPAATPSAAAAAGDDTKDELDQLAAHVDTTNCKELESAHNAAMVCVAHHQSCMPRLLHMSPY